MFYKLAFKNVTKSLKDYLVYFLTLTFGVCVFYVFNSIEAQQAMLDLSQSQHVMIEMLLILVDVLSVFVSFVLAFLILYANTFMIKRRKKELGIYLLLGMKKSRISAILLAETAIIALISLGVGLLLGVFASQGMAVLTAHMFDVQISQFRFIYSPSACGKTLLYFGIIFVLVMVFNSINVSRCRLIDLLTAAKKNQELKVKKLWLSVVLFVISVACLGAAYYMICTNGMSELDGYFYGSIILGSIGTLLFFLSLSGFLLRVVKSCKRLYLKNLNMFVLRQINSKINSTYVSMTVICILLLLAIGALGLTSGMSDYMKKMTNDVDATTPYDLTVENESLEDVQFNIEQYLQQSMGLDTEALFAQRHTAVLRDSGLQGAQIFQGFYGEEPASSYAMYNELMVPCMSLSDYNALLNLLGKEPLALPEGTFALFSNLEITHNMAAQFAASGKALTVNGQTLQPAFSQLLPTTVGNSTYPALLVLPDSVALSMEPSGSIYAVTYRGDKNQVEEVVLDKLLNGDAYSGMVESDGPYLTAMTRLTFVQMSMGYQAMILFIGIYLGIVFLIAGAAVLALQQLSEAADNATRYQLLRKLGVEQKMLGRAIVSQVSIYFFIPLGLAIIHSIVGIYAIGKTMMLYTGGISINSILITAAIVLLVYGGYFLATCAGCKSIARGRIVEDPN